MLIEKFYVPMFDLCVYVVKSNDPLYHIDTVGHNRKHIVPWSGFLMCLCASMFLSGEMQ